MSTKCSWHTVLCSHYQDSSLLAFRCLSSSTNQWPTPLSQSPKQSFHRKGPSNSRTWGNGGGHEQAGHANKDATPSTLKLLWTASFFPVAWHTRGYYNEYGFVFRIKGFLQGTKPVTPSEDTLPGFPPVTSGHTWKDQLGGAEPSRLPHKKQKGLPLLSLETTVFSSLLAWFGTFHWHRAMLRFQHGNGIGSLDEPVCQLPTRGLMTTAKPSTMHMQPRKSIEFVVRTANCSRPLVEDSSLSLGPTQHANGGCWGTCCCFVVRGLFSYCTHLGDFLGSCVHPFY